MDYQKLCSQRLTHLLQLEALLAQCLVAHPSFRPLAAHAQFFEQATALKTREKRVKRGKVKPTKAKDANDNDVPDEEEAAADLDISGDAKSDAGSKDESSSTLAVPADIARLCLRELDLSVFTVCCCFSRSCSCFAVPMPLYVRL